MIAIIPFVVAVVLVLVVINHIVLPHMLSVFNIEMMKRELARPDLQIYASCRLALADLNSGHYESAIARLKADADKLRCYDTPLNRLFESEESD